jgi:hypothetical protein
VALLPALACAADETYQGVLDPDNRRAPKIPIVVALRDLGVALEGTVKTSEPYKASAPIDNGVNIYGQCTVNVDLSKTLSLRLFGSCDAETFNGFYSLWDKQNRAITKGRFRLTRKAPEAVKFDGKRIITPSACLKANAQCLIACPRDDETAEFICSNRKLQTCKAQGRKSAPLPPDAD